MLFLMPYIFSNGAVTIIPIEINFPLFVSSIIQNYGWVGDDPFTKAGKSWYDSKTLHNSISSKE